MKIWRSLIEAQYNIVDLLPFDNYGKKNCHLNGLLFLITHMHHQFLTHEVHNDCIHTSKEMKYSLFGQYQWRNFIEKNHEHPFNQLFLEVDSGSNFKGYYSAYKPSKVLINAIVNWLKLNNHICLYNYLDIDQKVIVNKNTIFTDIVEDYDFIETIDINVTLIDADIYSRLNKENLTSKDLLMILKLKEIRDYVGSNGNKYHIKYKKHSSGRYYSKGHFSIQNLKKEIRNTILADYHEYDIESSAPLLLSQLYNKYTGEKVPSSVSLFIKNKTMIRQLFAEKYNVPLSVSKAFFTALFFGANLNESDLYAQSSITKMIGLTKIKQIISEKGYIYQLYKDTKDLFKVIAKHHRKKTNGRYEDVIGIGGDKLKIEKWKTSEVVAHLYQSMESVVLDSMVEFYIQSTGDRNYVRIHDCMYTKLKIDETKMYRYILQKNGINILLKRPISHELEDKDVRSLFYGTF